MTLNSDKLGKKGEARFNEICSDAELICNSSNYDRTGWDFIVEFPCDPPGPQSSLDKRHSPISCHVQVKTMWDANDTLKMRLSSAERLAKEPKPAFVYVFKVNRKLEIVSAYLIHMLDDNLSAVLKRLRKEQAKGAEAIDKINKKTIAFRASQSGRSLPPTGEALRHTLTVLCGSDPGSYLQKKREQLKSLGFETGRYEGTTTFLIGNNEELVDVFLGLKEVEITESKTFETRFGIKLPVSEPDLVKGIMHIQPNPADQCIVTIRDDPLSPPAVFEGDIFFPAIPKLPKGRAKFLVKTKFFQFLIDHQKIRFVMNEEATKSASMKIEDWINYLRMLVPFCKGTGSIAIEPHKLPPLSFPIAGLLPVPLTPA